MAKITLVELEDILDKISNGASVDDFKDKLIQAANGFKELTIAKQKDEQRSATALERLKKSSETDLSKQKEEFTLKTNKLKKEHLEEISKLKDEFELTLEKSKEQVLKEVSEAGTPSIEVFEILEQGEALVKTLISKTPMLSGLANDFLSKVKSLK